MTPMVCRVSDPRARAVVGQLMRDETVRIMDIKIDTVWPEADDSD